MNWLISGPDDLPVCTGFTFALFLSFFFYRSHEKINLNQKGAWIVYFGALKLTPRQRDWPSFQRLVFVVLTDSYANIALSAVVGHEVIIIIYHDLSIKSASVSFAGNIGIGG